MARDIGGMLAALMEAFKITDTPERLRALLELLVREQLTIRDQILPSMTDLARVKAQDKIGVKLWPRGREHEAVYVLVDKRWEAASVDVQRTFNLAGYLAFLLSPPVRGLVRLCGYDYMFIEPKPKDAEPEKKIVLVGR